MDIRASVLTNMAFNRRVLLHEDVDRIEKELSQLKHVLRYRYARSRVYGSVVDIACGSGFGSYLLSLNPDVQCVTGVDIDPEIISLAEKEFSTPKVNFVVEDIAKFSGTFDCLVSMETIEHLDNPSDLYHMALRLGVKSVILSFPSIKTTHFNHHHKHDLTIDMVSRIFSSGTITEFEQLFEDTTLLVIKLSR